MSVVNQQDADQTTFNNAFMSRLDAQTSTVAKVKLENPDSATINDIQKSANELFNIVGSSEGDASALVYPPTVSYIADGDNHKTAIVKIDAEMQTHEARLNIAEGDIAEHEIRIDNLETVTVDHESRLDVVEPKVAALETLTADHESRLDVVEPKVAALETLTADHESRLDVVEPKVAALETLTADHESRLDVVEPKVAALETLTADHESRLDTLETQNQTIGGDKTFTGNMVVSGNFTVNGTVTTVNSNDLEVVDKDILLNKGGNDASSIGAGVTVKRTVNDAAFRFDPSLSSKWKIGLVGSLYEVIVSGVNQVVSGVKDFVSGIKADTILESTTDAGVTVEGVLLKDGLADGRDIAADGAALDAHLIAADPHPQYLTTAEGNAAYDVLGSSATVQTNLTNHISAADPHPQYLTTAEGNAAYDVLGSSATVQTNLTNHIIAADPHPQYLTTAEGNAAYDVLGSSATVQTNLTNHIDNTSNPHGTTKAQVGLSNVTNDAQLKRSANDFTSFTEKLSPVAADVVLIEDSADSFNKKKVPFSSFGGGSGGGGKSTHAFKLNGIYAGLTNVFSVDGYFIAPENIKITDIYMYNETAGSGGQTSLDLKVKPFGSGAFTSIFLTTPKISNTAGAAAVVGVGDTVTGCVAPILTSLPFIVAAKSQLRLDLLTSQTGTPEGCGLIIVYEKV